MTHLHNYQIVGQDEKACVEVCKECKHKLITKKYENGKIDNKTYALEHKRDILQPTDKLFKKFYGNKAY